MAIEQHAGVDKLAARRLIESLLQQAGIRHRDLAEALYLSRGSLARKLGVRYPDRFTEEELRALAAFLEITADQRERLRRFCGLGDTDGQGEALAEAAMTPAATLPTPLTSFIGRDAERREVARLLATTRRLTLTGVGGIGKTRLALQVAADLTHTYVGGVFPVELLSAGSGAIPQVIATATGVREEPGQPLPESIVQRLRPRRALLLLDNCEHLLAESGRVIDRLLHAVPLLTILTTSREPLRISGETVWRVPSMAVVGGRWSAPHRSPTTDHPDAVRLFVERAQAVLPDFVLTSQTVTAVAEICRRLEGIPLAIELAAARVAVLSPAQIAERLDNSLRLLTGGARTAPGRHQTLRAALDWSHDLLSEAERILLRRLATFTGGFALEAADAVCGAMGNPQSAVGEGEPSNPVAPEYVLDILGRLVARSLVIAETGGGEARYRLLEPVRQYAQERLEVAGEGAAIARAQRDWCLALAEEAAPHLTGTAREAWVQRLELEQDNLRAALTWSLAQPDGAAPALRLSIAVWRFWHERGYFTEGRSWLEAALAHAGEAPAALRANALYAAGALAREQGDYARATALYESALSLWRAEEDRRGMAAVLNSLGMVVRDQGDYERARALYEESLVLRRGLGEEISIAATLNNLGLLAGDLGDYERAIAMHEESLAIKRRLGDRRGVAVSLNNLGMVALARRDWPRAEVLFHEGLTLFRDLRDTWAEAVLLHNAGRVARGAGDPASAAIYFADSLTLRRALEDKPGIAWCLAGFGGLAVDAGEPERAVRLLAAADALRTTIGATLPPHEREDWDRDLAAVRTALGASAFATAWSGGGLMPVEEAIDLALSNA